MVRPLCHPTPPSNGFCFSKLFWDVRNVNIWSVQQTMHTTYITLHCTLLQWNISANNWTKLKCSGILFVKVFANSSPLGMTLQLQVEGSSKNLFISTSSSLSCHPHCNPKAPLYWEGGEGAVSVHNGCMWWWCWWWWWISESSTLCLTKASKKKHHHQERSLPVTYGVGAAHWDLVCQMIKHDQAECQIDGDTPGKWFTLLVFGLLLVARKLFSVEGKPKDEHRTNHKWYLKASGCDHKEMLADQCIKQCL